MAANLYMMITGKKRPLTARSFGNQSRKADHRYRNGPNHNDFSSIHERRFSPSGDWQFTRPVAVLIGDRCVSSSESFILMMTTLEHVITIGDTTRGSSGNPREFRLGDGTRYTIPRWVAYKTDMTVLEDVGIFPDIPIPADSSVVNRQDRVLEKAIEILSAKL